MTIIDMGNVKEAENLASTDKKEPILESTKPDPEMGFNINRILGSLNREEINCSKILSPEFYNRISKTLFKVETALNIKEFSEENYFDKILFILNECREKKLDDKELVHLIGELNHYINLPLDYKILVPETRFVVEKIKEGGKFDIGLNGYLIPGSLSSLRKLLESKIVNSENISIDFSHGVNMQEGIRFVKEANNSYSGAITHFDLGDEIEKISIKLGDSSSVAHGVVFQSKYLGDNKFEYTLDAGENVFLGINTQIGSGIKIGDNTSVWWGTILGNDVKIGSNVVVGQGVDIEDGSNIPSNCLVPNGAIIKEGFKIVSYEEYMSNEIDFDSMEVGKENRRNFVIQLSNDKNEQSIQFNEINKDYGFMAKFNEHHVVPENKFFAVINTFLATIEKHFPNVGIIRDYKFKSKLTLGQLKEKLPYLDDEYINLVLNKDSKLTVKAFPKDKEKFVNELMPKVIKSIREGQDITQDIKEYLDFPELPNNIEEVFFGTNILTGKSRVFNNSIILDTFIRADELREGDEIIINNSKLIKGVLHGGGNKTIQNSTVLNVVGHGNTSIIDSNIGDVKHPSVYHNSLLNNSIQEHGGVVSNGTKIDNSNIGFGVILMPGSQIQDSVVGDNTIIGDSYINNYTVDKYSYIGEGFYLQGNKSNKGLLDGILINKNKPRHTGLLTGKVSNKLKPPK